MIPNLMTPAAVQAGCAAFLAVAAAFAPPAEAWTGQADAHAWATELRRLGVVVDRIGPAEWGQIKAMCDDPASDIAGASRSAAELSGLPSSVAPRILRVTVRWACETGWST